MEKGPSDVFVNPFPVGLGKLVRGRAVQKRSEDELSRYGMGV
jgi:hypothetical protein